MLGVSPHRFVTFFGDHQGARTAGADFLVLATEWNEVRALDLARLAGLLRARTMIDLRNVYDPREMAAAGWRYVGVGRESHGRETA